MIGIPLGLLAGNAIEWAFHKYVLHGLGKNKNSMWSFHWHEHHRAARQNGMMDEAYSVPILEERTSWPNAQQKEAMALIAGCVLVSPLFSVAPWFTSTLWFCAAEYYYKHRKSHLNTEWAKEKLPWHYDHHMGKNQNTNWCVVRPWMDYIMGTREPMEKR